MVTQNFMYERLLRIAISKKIKNTYQVKVVLPDLKNKLVLIKSKYEENEKTLINKIHSERIL
jgi:hypothetical protein